MRSIALAAAGFGALVGVASLAFAEITNIRGFAEVVVERRVAGEVHERDSASERFPETDPDLPLQVLALLLPPLDPNDALEPNLPGAAAIAAQFADPQDLVQPNPEEFAINLTLSSVAPQVDFVAKARIEETRTLLFAPGELGPGLDLGDTAPLTGRVFVDGALAVFAARADRDLTGAFVRLNVAVRQVGPGDVSETVFEGSVELRGANGGSEVAASGDFPVASLILSDLGLLADDFAIFRLLIIPQLAIDYDFTAVVGEEFDLVATVTVDARNVPDEAGVAAVIGAPTDTLAQVIAATEGDPIAATVLSAVASERELPTGVPAFPDAQGPGLCAPLGFATLALLLVGLVRGASRGR